MADQDVPAVAQAAADEVGKIVEKYMPADEPPTADGGAVCQGALVLSLGYIFQRGTQGVPEVEQFRLPAFSAPGSRLRCVLQPLNFGRGQQ